MITLQEICRKLDQLLASQNFEDVCPNGLQVEGKKEVKKITTAVSASLETIQLALELKSDLLIVHHGLFWARDTFPIVGVKQKKISLLLKNELSLVAYHLPLDAHPDLGNNWRAAMDLGWENLEPFGKFGKVSVGVKGTFPPVSREKFIEKLEQYYQHPATIAPGGKGVISSAALISGSAHREISQAKAEGVDVFITGSFDEPNWYAAKEHGIDFIAMGHSATEKVGPRALSSFLAQSFALPVEFIDVPNPF